jgi:hypothetical protein
MGIDWISFAIGAAAGGVGVPIVIAMWINSQMPKDGFRISW